MPTLLGWAGDANGGEAKLPTVATIAAVPSFATFAVTLSVPLAGGNW